MINKLIRTKIPLKIGELVTVEMQGDLVGADMVDKLDRYIDLFSILQGDYPATKRQFLITSQDDPVTIEDDGIGYYQFFDVIVNSPFVYAIYERRE